jgi:hypothetical protein
LRQQAEISKSNTLRRTNEIKKISKENEDLEKMIIEFHKNEVELKAKIEDEESFNHQHSIEGLK